jgi:DNA-binding protein YbaB
MDIQEQQRNEVTVINDVEVLIDRVRTAHREAQAQADKAKEYASKAIDRAYEAGDLLLLL